MKVGIFHTAFLGDLVMIGRLVEALWRAGHEIIVFSNKAGTLLFKEDSRIHATICIEKGKGAAKLSHFKINTSVVHAAKLDALLVPHRSFHSALLTKLSRVKKTVGFANSTGAFLFEETVPYLSHLHESARCLNLAPEWLVPRILKEQILLEDRNYLQPKAPLVKFEAAFPLFFHNNHPFFMIAPGSVWATKMYPPALLSKVVLMLLKKHPDLRCVVSGGPEDLDAVNLFISCFTEAAKEETIVGAEERIINALRCLPIPELVTLTGRAAFVISNDSAPFHIACAVKTPVLGIYGPTAWDTGFGPVGKSTKVVSLSLTQDTPLGCQPCSSHGHKSCPLQHHRCMRELQPEHVVKAALDLVPSVFNN